MSENEDYSDHIKDRTIERDGDKIQIKTQHHEKVNAEGFMDMFRSKVVQYRQMVNQHSNLEKEIQERLEEHNKEMKLLHALDESQEQTEAGKAGPNSVSEGAISAYVELQQYKSKKENLEDDLHDLESDIEDIWDMAQEIVENFEDFDMPQPVKLLDNFLPEEEINKFFESSKEPEKKEIETDGEE